MVSTQARAEKVTCKHITMHGACGGAVAEKCLRGAIVDWFPAAVLVLISLSELGRASARDRHQLPCSALATSASSLHGGGLSEASACGWFEFDPEWFKSSVCTKG